MGGKKGRERESTEKCVCVSLRQQSTKKNGEGGMGEGRDRLGEREEERERKGARERARRAGQSGGRRERRGEERQGER